MVVREGFFSAGEEDPPGGQDPTHLKHFPAVADLDAHLSGNRVQSLGRFLQSSLYPDHQCPEPTR